MKFQRASGILLHPSSLPGRFGIGDLGPQAYSWVDFLAKTGCSLWQILPLGPTGYGDSPYQCFSAFAGNPYLISPDLLVEQSLLTEEDLEIPDSISSVQVDYGAVIPFKLKMLQTAYNRYRSGRFPGVETEFETFRRRNQHWLVDFSMFMTLKELNDWVAWTGWPRSIRQRDPGALDQVRWDYQETIDRQAFQQFLFFQQWEALHAYANEKGILIVGDIPIFVAQDSVDVWANPNLFHLDKTGLPTVVAGVPPDYFSPTGQLWGNPLYRWEVHAQGNYAWWLDRLRMILGTVDIVRLDHFRGFAGYWEIPAKAKTAASGRWVPGPGEDFLRIVLQELGELPIIAEDLGEITPDVVELRDQFLLPGMKILQFAFDSGPTNEFLPHHYPNHCVVYTGTHDNDTTMGWFQRVEDDERNFACDYLQTDEESFAWDMIRAVWASVAVFALAPMQDLLSLDNKARMNYPSEASGNWTWRMPPDAITQILERRLSKLNYLYSRTRISEDKQIPDPPL